MADAAQNNEQTSSTEQRRRRVIGLVVSNKMDKTLVVEIQRQIKHPVYKKYIRRRKKLYVHDAENQGGIGDRVEVQEVTRPLSRLKRYGLVRIVEKAK